MPATSGIAMRADEAGLAEQIAEHYRDPRLSSGIAMRQAAREGWTPPEVVSTAPKVIKEMPLNWAEQEASLRSNPATQSWLLVPTGDALAAGYANYVLRHPSDRHLVENKNYVEITFLPDRVTLIDGAKTYNTPDLESVINAWVEGRQPVLVSRFELMETFDP